MSDENAPPEGIAAPWLIIARAGGPHGESENVQARFEHGGEPSEATLARCREAIAKLYRDTFGRHPAQVGVGAVPWFEEIDGDE